MRVTNGQAEVICEPGNENLYQNWHDTHVLWPFCDLEVIFSSWYRVIFYWSGYWQHFYVWCCWIRSEQRVEQWSAVNSEIKKCLRIDMMHVFNDPCVTLRLIYAYCIWHFQISCFITNIFLYDIGRFVVRKGSSSGQQEPGNENMYQNYHDSRFLWPLYDLEVNLCSWYRAFSHWSIKCQQFPV